MRRVVCIVMLTACSHLAATPSVLETSQAATDASNFKVLYIFDSIQGGRIPVGTLLAADGTLYGTTNFGGTISKRCTPGVGCGTVFALTPPSKERRLYAFNGVSDGTRPYAGLIDVNGTFYGTTQSGGEHNEGVVFAIKPSGSEHTVFAFGGKDGNDPRAGLTSDSSGALYGTTYYGGRAGIGAVFKIGPSGKETVLHSFLDGADGAKPLGALIDVGNVLYGTTSLGGTNNAGTVFSIDTDGSHYNVLHSFEGGKADGAFPFAGLTKLKGSLYGTTQQGGALNKGTIYAIATSGSERIIHSFGAGSDGFYPYSALAVFNRQLYGTTAYGGSKSEMRPNGGKKANSLGTIYTVSPSGKEEVLHDFTGGAGGRVPYASLTAMRGTLYGVTIWGGDMKGNKGGEGTVFEFTP